MVSIMTQIYDDQTRPINLFGLYVLFSQYMSWDNTLYRELFHSNFVLFTRISTRNLWKDKESASPGTSIGKTNYNIQAKEFYSHRNFFIYA